MNLSMKVFSLIFTLFSIPFTVVCEAPAFCSSFHTKLYIPIDGSNDNDVDYLHTKAQALAMQISAIDVLLTQ